MSVLIAAFDSQVLRRLPESDSLTVVSSCSFDVKYMWSVPNSQSQTVTQACVPNERGQLGWTCQKLQRLSPQRRALNSQEDANEKSASELLSSVAIWVQAFWTYQWRPSLVLAWNYTTALFSSRRRRTSATTSHQGLTTAFTRVRFISSAIVAKEKIQFGECGAGIATVKLNGT